ncbi:MAG TPA: hypothetical protein VM889_05255 [Candidatus Thermoplasmatota archaeon]|nr:hypothetical protein [Candidatus Thermoplasmatota archaeon]
MTSYEQLAEKTHRFGKNAYLEVARKRVTEKGEATEFLIVSRGFIQEDGSKRWTKFVTLPATDETRKWLSEALAAV